ncbi:hypothetical protein LTR66_004430 [Elasticomyces elasticus]|nr:hypothetical protein LTR66_004430 [Elasticomyces elasticus]
MQCTARRLAPPGFWKRSLDEFKRLSNIAIKLEGLTVPGKPYPLITLDNPDSVELCKKMSDADIGGFSRMSLDYVPASAESKDPPHACFSGSISIDLPPNRPDVQRSGYAAWRTRDRARTLFGKALWDIDPYSYLALRVKSDGRAYHINIQTESIVPTDIHQHRLYAKNPGEWETVVVPFREFVRTNYGMVVEPQREMLRQRVRSVGIGLIDRIPGPFELRIAEIYATNQDSDAEQQANVERNTKKEPEEPEKILI